MVYDLWILNISTRRSDFRRDKKKRARVFAAKRNKECVNEPYRTENTQQCGVLHSSCEEQTIIMMKVSVNSRVKSNVKCIVGCLVLLSLATTQTEAGSCRESAQCCSGRDSSCVVQKTPINTINEDPYEKPCYCDHACLKLGDCCGDFKSYCGGESVCCDVKNIKTH